MYSLLSGGWLRPLMLGAAPVRLSVSLVCDHVAERPGRMEQGRSPSYYGLHGSLGGSLLASMIRYIFAVAVCAVLTSCGKPGASTSTAPANLSARAHGVRLVSSKVEAGKATEAQLQQGLQSAADALSAVYAEACKAHPQLKGHLRGTFQIEADGTPRMFMERGSEFTPPEGKSVSEDFIGATFGGKWKFPKIGGDLMVTVDYELAPGS